MIDTLKFIADLFAVCAGVNAVMFVTASLYYATLSEYEYIKFLTDKVSSIFFLKFFIISFCNLLTRFIIAWCK